MNLFVLLSKKIIFPEMDISEDNSEFDMYIKIFNDGNSGFIRSVYKFMIVHYYLSKSSSIPFRCNLIANANANANKNVHERQDKYNFLKRNVENVFFQQAEKDQFLDYFCKIQKHYFAFSRLLNAWKYKRAQVTVSDDLYLNPLDATGKNIFIVVQNQKKYLFSIANLINMVNNALSHTCHFFASPLILKNPYNNGVFNKSNLYNLYFAIKQSTFIMPALFHCYFLVNFDISRFREQYEGIIREVSIENYVKNTDYNVLYNHVFTMMQEHKGRIFIDPDFPKEDLVNIMRPYLRLYYVSMYSLDEYKKLNAFSELHKKLHKFYKYNPKFGRKIKKSVCNSNFKISYKTMFNDHHIDYYKPLSTEDFMKTHQECVDNDSGNSSDEEPEVALNSEFNTGSNNTDSNNIYHMLLFENNTNVQSPSALNHNVSNDESASDSDSDADSISDIIERRRDRYQFNIDDEETTEYQQIIRNILLADENQLPAEQPSNNYIIETEESDTESESDEMVVIISESESDMDADVSDDDDE